MVISNIYEWWQTTVWIEQLPWHIRLLLWFKKSKIIQDTWCGMSTDVYYKKYKEHIYIEAAYSYLGRNVTNK